MTKNLLPLTALCLALSACTTLPFTSGAPPSSQAVAAYREQIDLAGRLNVVYQKNDQPESATVNFTWQQQAARTDVALFLPVGSTLATIAVTPQEAVLTQSGKPPRSAPDVDTLSARLLGWSLPVSGLRDWLQGHATSADGKRFVASPQNDHVITQDGWRVHYVSWQDAAAPGAPPQPRRIDAERNASAQADAVALRIVLDPVSAVPATAP